VFTRVGLTLRSNRTSLPRIITTTDYRRYSSILLKANQVLTKVRRIIRIKDPSRRRKGLLTSLTSSAIAIVRKATIRINIMPRSSVMTYKDPDRITTTTTSFVL
jgi:hypothetical protein